MRTNGGDSRWDIALDEVYDCDAQAERMLATVLMLAKENGVTIFMENGKYVIAWGGELLDAIDYVTGTGFLAAIDSAYIRCRA